MTLKEPAKFSNWSFIVEDPEGKEIEIPSGGRYANTLSQLTAAVLQHIAAYDGATNGEYSKNQRELADKEGVTFDKYIQMLIQHQICLRYKGSVPCWTGLGDKIHLALSAVDGFVAKTPEVVRQRMERAIKVMTPSKSKTLGGCSACGGTRKMDPNANNLGRAGFLNRMMRK